MKSEVYTAEAIEVLLRRLIEQAIVTGYIHKQSGAEAIDRFRKTSALEFARSWGADPKPDGHDLPVAQLPSYRQMAEATDRELYVSYQRASYLAHPRGALPYSIVEDENEQRGIENRDFYHRRCNIALVGVAECLDRIRQIFEDEDGAYRAKLGSA